MQGADGGDDTVLHLEVALVVPPQIHQLVPDVARQNLVLAVRVLVAEFSLLEVAEFLLSSREDDTRSWDNFLVYFSMPCQPEGLGIHIYKLLASQTYAKMLV